MPANQVVNQEAHGDLALLVGTAINGGVDRAVFKIRDHFSKQICGDHHYFTRQPEHANGAANGQAVPRANVDPAQGFPSLEEGKTLSHGVVLVIQSVDDFNHLASLADLWKN